MTRSECNARNARSTRLLTGLALLAMAAAAPGCASKKPVLYPNSHLERAGAEQSQRDIADCIQLAKTADLEKSKSAEAAKSGAGGAAVGAAAGAAGGAIAGNAGRGAGVGAATGAIVGVSRGLFKASEPDPLYVNYVNICLREKGYQIVGWK